MSNNFLAEKDAQFVWHPFDIFRNSSNLLVERTLGNKIYTKDGRILTDMVSSWWVNLHGHNHPHIVHAIQKQAEKLSHVIFSGFSHEPAITLAERLIGILPGKMDKIFFSDNGSTAVEVGLKMALQYWFNIGRHKTKILAFEGAYHGDTFGAMSLAGPEPFNKPFQHHLFEVVYLPFPDEQNFEVIEHILFKEFETGEVAALVYEPMIQGVGGMRLFNKTLQEKILEKCRLNEVLLVADEVMTGFGRTGKLFASEFFKVKPDIICLSKGITGGFLPLGATSATKNIYEVFNCSDKRKIFLHGHSYTGNALSCAAANASLDLLLTEDCKQRIESISKTQSQFLRKLEGNKRLEWFVSLGTILTMSQIPEKSKGYFDSKSEKAYQYFLERNLLLRPLGNALYLSPPYCTEISELIEAQNVVLEYLEK
ncbi:MAG: adenosylmethionine--8-amino-7-oxononanoate transaminase [Opitutaceae bacterium]|nr:adenosylmethionine--8-amino-7-oxononanoate transaminase [Cytophagales bacterium]